MQTVKISEAGDTMRVVVYSRGSRWDSPAGRKQKRAWRRAAWRWLNFRTCREKLDERIACNFGPGDWHIVYTLAPEYETGDYRQLRKYWRAALRTLREICRRRGGPVPVYIYVMEGLHGDKRLHIHALMPARPHDIEDYHAMWRYGEVLMTPIRDVPHRGSLGQYLTKEPEKLGRDRNDRNLFVASHSCIKPTVSCYSMADGEAFEVPDGYTIEHQGSEQNEFGYYLYYILRRRVPS